MPELDPALWREMMDYLRQRHAPICRQWFEQLDPVDLAGGLLRIQTATGVQQNYLQKKCLEPFTEAAQDATGQLVAVRFVNGPVEPRKTPAPGTGSRAAPEGTLGTGNAGSAPGNGARAASHGDQDAEPRGRYQAAPGQAPSPGSDPRTWSPPHPGAAAADPGRRFISDFDSDQMVLSPDYSFDNFITGPNNQLAYAASVAVANQPGTAYNPLFIHGGVGLGKTHLLQAICQQILGNRPDFQILYVSCDAFMNQFIDCVQAGKMAEFRHRYRHVDMLVIDDIHFLGNRERSQEEFFHTFNELYQSNRQIVLSSDAPPAEIPHLEERLVSRFQWGLVTQVSQPSYETRVAILRAKSRLRGMEVPDAVIQFIANKIDTNARELEGAIITIQAHAHLQGEAIDMNLARAALGEPAGPPRTSQVTLQHIIDTVTAYYNLKLSDLQSRRRHKSVTEPRQVCMWLARKRTRFSLEEIGGYFGGRDHTTVMHSIKTVDTRNGQDPDFARQVDQLDREIQRAVETEG